MNAEAYLRGQIEKRIDEAKSLVQSAESAGRGLNDNERANVEGLTAEADKLRGQLDEVVSQRELREGIDNLGKSFLTTRSVEAVKAARPSRTIGEAVVASDGYKALMNGGLKGSWEFQVEFKANETITSDGVPAEDYVPGIQRLLSTAANAQAPTLMSVLPEGATNSNRIRYIAETAATNSAAAAAEVSGSAGVSTLVHADASVEVEKINTVLYVSGEMLADGPAFQSEIDGRLAGFVRNEEEDQVINGNGSTPQLDGLLQQVTQTQALGADGYADCIYKAKTDVRVGSFSNHEATHILVHPTDWQTLRLSKDANDRYLMDMGPWSAAGASEPGIWGLTPIVTQRIAAGTALVGAFSDPGALKVFRRGGVTVDVTNSHSTYFLNDIVAVRASSRLALVMYQIGAFSEVTGL